MMGNVDPGFSPSIESCAAEFRQIIQHRKIANRFAIRSCRRANSAHPAATLSRNLAEINHIALRLEVTTDLRHQDLRGFISAFRVSQFRRRPWQFPFYPKASCHE
jgi:hypothetical protein